MKHVLVVVKMDWSVLVIVIVMFLSISSTVKVCTNIYNKATKKS